MTKKQPFKLTVENYFSKDRPHISNSHISDYLKSPNYYFKKHVEKIVETKVTDPMKRGSIVDAMLTQEENPYQMKVLKREDPDLYEEQKEMDDRFLVTETCWEQARQVAEHIKDQPIWNENLDSASFQVLLEGELNGVKVCGLADRIDSLGDQKYRLIDLKVVNPIKIDNTNKWYWNTMEMGYLRQMALYQHLWAHSQGIPTEFVSCAHIVGAYVDDQYCISKGFLIPQELLDVAFQEILTALEGIKHKQYDEPKTTWQSATTLPTVS